jgi:hypothetical protein
LYWRSEKVYKGFMAIKLPKSERAVPTGVSLPASLAEQARALAKAERRTFSNLVKLLLEAELNRHPRRSQTKAESAAA